MQYDYDLFDCFGYDNHLAVGTVMRLISQNDLLNGSNKNINIIVF